MSSTQSTTKTYKQILYTYFENWTYDTESDAGQGSLLRLTKDYYHPIRVIDYTGGQMCTFINQMFHRILELNTETTTPEIVKDNMFKCMLCNKSNLFQHADSQLVNECARFSARNPSVLFTTEFTPSEDYSYAKCFKPHIDTEWIMEFITKVTQDTWTSFVQSLIQEYTLEHTMLFLHYALGRYIRSCNYPAPDECTDSGVMLLENLMTNVLCTVRLDSVSVLANSYGLCLDLLDNFQDILFNYFINNRKMIFMIKNKYSNITAIDHLEQRYNETVELVYNLDVFPMDLVKFIVTYL